MSNSIETPSVLAFERKLDPSDALFFAGAWEARHTSEHWKPVVIREKSVRGTHSNRLNPSQYDKAKDSNLQTVDVATLPSDADTLKVQFTLRVLAGTGTPSACNSMDYRNKLDAIVAGYVKQYDFSELARRYAANLANGRFLWRNRAAAENVSIHVAHIKDGKPTTQWEFNALTHSLPDLTATAAASELTGLANLIADGLAGRTHVLLQITAFVRQGMGQEIFPSQEMIMERKRGKKGKTLYDVADVAAIHSQKIGNAIRTIDTWYTDAEDNGPIAVEPYGSVTVQGKAWRQPKDRQDFYTLLDNWMIKDSVPSPEQQHYVVATLIRGGVFGKADEKADKKDQKD